MSNAVIKFLWPESKSDRGRKSGFKAQGRSWKIIKAIDHFSTASCVFWFGSSLPGICILNNLMVEIATSRTQITILRAAKITH